MQRNQSKQKNELHFGIKLVIDNYLKIIEV